VLKYCVLQRVTSFPTGKKFEIKYSHLICDVKYFALLSHTVHFSSLFGFFTEVKGEMPQGKLKVKTNAKPPQKKNKPPKVTWLITVP